MCSGLLQKRDLALCLITAGEPIEEALKKKFGPSAPQLMQRVVGSGRADGVQFADWKWRANTVKGAWCTGWAWWWVRCVLAARVEFCAQGAGRETRQKKASGGGARTACACLSAGGKAALEMCSAPSHVSLPAVLPPLAGHVLVALARRHGKSHEANEALFRKRQVGLGLQQGVTLQPNRHVSFSLQQGVVHASRFNRTGLVAATLQGPNRCCGLSLCAPLAATRRAPTSRMRRCCWRWAASWACPRRTCRRRWGEQDRLQRRCICLVCACVHGS